MTFSKQQAKAASYDYFRQLAEHEGLSAEAAHLQADLQAGVFVDKYALCDKQGVYYEATPDAMHRRLAKEFARIEAKYPNALTETEIYEE